MNINIATELFHRIEFVEDGSNCWIPEKTTRSIRYKGKMFSLAFLSYVLSGRNVDLYRHKQEIIRVCGNLNCFNPDHLIFDEMDRFSYYINCELGVEGCWEWTKSKDVGGYGIFISDKYGREKSHRIAYMEWVGEIPNGMFVCHVCDNTSCCNPHHLFLGTNQDNMKDKTSKNRQHHPTGILNGRCRITPEIVREIRKEHDMGLSYRQIVKKYSISQTQVARIIKMECWSWV